MKMIEKILDEMQEHLDQEILDVEKETISDVGVGIEICMNIVKEIAKESRREEMTEQDYREKTVALKESSIPIDMQKYFQNLLDKEFNKKGKWIPCSKKMPEQHIDEIVDFGDDDQVIAWYSKVNKQWKNSSTDIAIKREVVAWQQLPEPYKESCTSATEI